MLTKERKDQIRAEQNQADRKWFAEMMKQEQPDRLQRMGIGLDTAAILVIPATMLFLNRFWTGCCILCCIGSVYLTVRYPGYFSLLEDRKSRQERCGAEAFLLILPYWVPVSVAGISFTMRYGIGSWKNVLILSAGVTVLFGLLLWRLIPELCRRRQHMVAAFGLALFISIGTVFSVNYLLELDPPDRVTAIVTESRPGSGKSAPSLTVELPNGRKVRVPVDYEQFRQYAAGDCVAVDCYGGLGIDYYGIP